MSVDSIRSGQLRDIERLVQIDTLVNASPWGETSFAKACSPDIAGRGIERALVMASKQDWPVGFVIYAVVLGEGCIHNIAVDPQYQGSGRGAQLLQRALDDMRVGHAFRCVLEVRVSNRAAMNMYYSAGFALDGVRKHYYRTKTGREDALLLSRPL